MADTGAPYFIPYVEPTDLVRDYPAADEASADAIAAALDAIPVPAGIGSNVVQTVKTNTFSTSSGTFVDVTGLTVTITPSSDTAKVLVIANYRATMNEVVGNHQQLVRGSTPIYLGGADGNRIRASGSFQGVAGTGGALASFTFTLFFLDSPASSTAVTYKLQMRRGTALTAILGGGMGPNNADGGSTPSSITAIEVAA